MISSWVVSHLQVKLVKLFVTNNIQLKKTISPILYSTKHRWVVPGVHEKISWGKYQIIRRFGLHCYTSILKRYVKKRSSCLFSKPTNMLPYTRKKAYEESQTFFNLERDLKLIKKECSNTLGLIIRGKEKREFSLENPRQTK